MASSPAPAPHSSPWPMLGRRAVAGALGGFAGGIVFGFLMAQMGLLPVVASLIGSDSAGAGLILQLMISVVAGLGLTVPFAGRFLTGYRNGILAGLAYGVLWWVLWCVAGLLPMPRMPGMPVSALALIAALSLMGHLIYGAVLGLTAVRVLKGRTRPLDETP
ncbi:hypothetical protein [Arthrobacter sp. UYCu712]|uniref:hypothetical protein n=1 Tax=Arthrobacter sp. UYCu712 TaxID=3156340 RepID=UPI00339715DC